jgi:hypothetical protein
MIALEYRYFGISYSLGLNCSTSTYDTWPKSAYKPLSLNNVFGDGRSLVPWIKTVACPEAKDAKVIIGQIERDDKTVIQVDPRLPT